MVGRGFENKRKTKKKRERKKSERKARNSNRWKLKCFLILGESTSFEIVQRHFLNGSCGIRIVRFSR